MRRGVIGGAALAVLWLVTGWGAFALQSAGGGLATVGQLLPSPMRYDVLGMPRLWATLVQVLTVAALVAGYAALTAWFGRIGRLAFVAGWLAAILAAFLVGASLDLGNFFAWIGRLGVRGALGTMGAAPVTAWWAVLAGWLPALVATRLRAARGERGERDTSEDAAPARRARFATTTATTLVAVVAIIALPFAAQSGSAAGQEELRQEQVNAEAAADPDGAAAPDPAATGDPVPTVAPTSNSAPEDACTAEDTTILAPAPDAATGHRGQVLQLINTSDTPCTVEGYPDVAYGDQNGHLLDVAIEHGRSFMAEDPGPTQITLAHGESVAAVIGWDANSVHGQLAARSLWVAAFPGTTRLTWDVSLDVIPGATVHVTAWHVRPPAGT